MIALACPRCHTLLKDISSTSKQCPQEGLAFQLVDGIWRMLLPGREEMYNRFIRDYETIRRAEGRGSENSSYYRNLPYHDSAEWRIRSASYDAFIKHILEPTEARLPLSILDLGAGNSWLSNRLAGRGHHVAAVDLTTNDFDGLGSYSFFETMFLSVQAEFAALPFLDHAVDLIVFNASLHYSTSYEETLTESIRILKDTGMLVILDSPFYHDPASGVKMVREREIQFKAKYGFASNSLSSENYLTYERLEELGRKLNLQWNFYTPFYGFSWSLRPLAARLLGRREPARFHVIAGSRITS